MIKLDERKNFTGSTTPHTQAQKIVTRRLTRDLFAVTNLLVFKYWYLHFIVHFEQFCSLTLLHNY